MDGDAENTVKYSQVVALYLKKTFLLVFKEYLKTILDGDVENTAKILTGNPSAPGTPGGPRLPGRP